MKKTIYTFIFSGCLSMAVPSTADAQAGSLDPTFGSGGIVTTNFGDGANGHSVAIQSDDKIVLAGGNYNGTDADFALVRYNSDGSLDNTFGTGGKVTTAIGNSNDVGYSVAIQGDGKIVVAGSSSDGPYVYFALVRYNGDGTLDNTFDADGKVTTALGSSNDAGYSVAIQSDNKIVVAGNSSNGSDIDFGLVRYNSDGSLDDSFGTGGKVTTAIGSSHDDGRSIAIQSDGKIVVAGQSDNGADIDFALVRYNSDGTLDNTFDSDGKVTTAIGNDDDAGYSVAIPSDGKIVVAGYSKSGADVHFALVRYNSDGSLDNTFDSDGKVTTAVGSSYDFGNSVAIGSNGKIVVTGVSYNSANYDFALVSYNSDGSLDTTFSSDGKTTTAIGNSDDQCISVAIQGDGKIVVAGYSGTFPQQNFAVARYNVDSLVGIAENFDERNTITISPNPFSNELFIKGAKEKEEILIYNVMGKEILRQKIVSSETRIETENLLPGLYLINFFDGNKTVIAKLTKL